MSNNPQNYPLSDDISYGGNVSFGENAHCVNSDASFMHPNEKYEAPRPWLQDYSLQFPHYMKNNAFTLEQIRKGIMVSACDFTLPENTITDFTSENSTISFSVVLSGSFKVSCPTSLGKVREFEYVPQEIVYKTHNVSGSFCIKGKTTFQMVTVHMSDEAIFSIFGDCKQCEMLINNMQAQENYYSLLSRQKLSTQIKIAALQFMQCPEHMVNRKLYLEGKTLEILALYFDNLLPQQKSKALNRGDVERIHEARDILFSNIAEPPSLAKLSHAVGINECKLKKGFKKVFGNTAYGMLREHRMQTAKELLLNGGANVTMTASSVGYINISKFILAFKNYYKVTPGELLSSRQSRYR